MRIGDQSEGATAARDALVASLRADLTHTQAELDAQRARADAMTDTQRVRAWVAMLGLYLLLLQCVR